MKKGNLVRKSLDVSIKFLLIGFVGIIAFGLYERLEKRSVCIVLISLVCTIVVVATRTLFYAMV